MLFHVSFVPGLLQPKCTHILRRLHVGLKAIHVNSAMFFPFLQMSWGNRRFPPVWNVPNTLLQPHESGDIRWDELVFDSRGRRPVVSILVVTVHDGRSIHRHFGLTYQRNLWANMFGDNIQKDNKILFYLNQAKFYNQSINQ